MKRVFLLFAATAFFVSSSFCQINQDFVNIPYLHSLSNQCWQFYGTQLTTSPTSGDKYLSLTPPTIDGTAWVKTAYMHLTKASSISFSYQMAAPLLTGTSRKLAVRLLGLDGTSTPLGEVKINQDAGTAPFSFQATSPITGVQRLVVEVTSAGNDLTALYLDNLVVDGNYEYNPPYACRDKEDGAVSIHYLKSFSGQMATDRVRLQWIVAENENNKHFEIERSNDGKEFKTIGTVTATGKVAVETYNYEEVLTAHSYYRLKLVSRTGIRMYSNVLFFKSPSSEAILTLLQNPVQQVLRLGFTAESKNAALLTVYNLNGVRIYQRHFQAQKDYNQLSFPLDAQITPGIYIAEIVCGQKRMTARLLKE
jgi:hypothetical protein